MLKSLAKILPLGRARYLAGYDLAGNAFYEFPSRSGSTDPRHTRRVIDWKVKREPCEYDQSAIPAQWVSWLRHTRRTAPTIEELQADAERIARVQANARLIAERDAAWRASLLQAPPSEGTSASLQGGSTSPQQRSTAAQIDNSSAQAGPSAPSQTAGAAPQPAQAQAPPTPGQGERGGSRRGRAIAAVPTSEVRSKQVDSDRVQRSLNIVSSSSGARKGMTTGGSPATQASSSPAGRRQGGLDSEAELLNEDAARRPDEGVWEASRRRLRERTGHA